jgi:hypothetical protein
MTSPLRLSADVELSVDLEVKLTRAPLRARCSVCHIRRVLYRIVVVNVRVTAGGASEARCAECWGVRP